MQGGKGPHTPALFSNTLVSGKPPQDTGPLCLPTGGNLSYLRGSWEGGSVVEVAGPLWDAEKTRPGQCDEGFS